MGGAFGQDRPYPEVDHALGNQHRVRTPHPFVHAAPTAAAPAPEEVQRFERPEPNQLWQLDFKGYVEVERRRVYPLTVLDDHSRFLLALRCCTDQTYAS